MSFINLQVGEIPKILPPSFVRNLLGPGELFACSFPENENSASFESIVRVRSLVDRQLGLLNGDLKPGCREQLSSWQSLKIKSSFIWNST